MDGNKLDFEYWVSEFNLFRDSITIDKVKCGNALNFMDLYTHMYIYIYIYIYTLSLRISVGLSAGSE